jgi:hypothetical protein
MNRSADTCRLRFQGATPAAPNEKVCLPRRAEFCENKLTPYSRDTLLPLGPNPFSHAASSRERANVSGRLKSPMDNTSLAPACSDANRLLTHLMRAGITIDQETIDAVQQLQAGDATLPLSPEAKTKFLVAYGQLAKLAAPVTAESLRACSHECATPWKRWPWSEPKPFSQAERAVIRHHTWASAALIVLLIVQIYWLVGATLVAGVRRQDVHPTPNQPATVAQPSATPAVPKTEAEAKEDDAREDTHVWLLSAWSAPWRWIPDVYQHWFPDKDVQSNHFWELSIGTSFILEILQTYVLPLLYGWVGAMALVLRSLIVAVKNRTFRVNLNVEYRLRVYLGLLAGLVIGWFLSSKGNREPGVADLTPAALSFVAGYSVEIMFSTMDRLVAGFVTAFGGSTVDTPQAPKT